MAGAEFPSEHCGRAGRDLISGPASGATAEVLVTQRDSGTRHCSAASCGRIAASSMAVQGGCVLVANSGSTRSTSAPASASACAAWLVVALAAQESSLVPYRAVRSRTVSTGSSAVPRAGRWWVQRLAAGRTCCALVARQDGVRTRTVVHSAVGARDRTGSNDASACPQAAAGAHAPRGRTLRSNQLALPSKKGELPFENGSPSHSCRAAGQLPPIRSIVLVRHNRPSARAGCPPTKCCSAS